MIIYTHGVRVLELDECRVRLRQIGQKLGTPEFMGEARRRAGMVSPTERRLMSEGDRPGR